MKINVVLFLMLISFSTVFSQKKSKNDSINKKDKKVNIVPIPMINYSNSFGASLGAFVTGFYHAQKNDTISPLSSSGVIGRYSTNDTWFVATINKFYLNEDKLRIKAVAGGGSINFQTFVDSPNFVDVVPFGFSTYSDEGTFVDYNTKLQFVYAEVLAKVKGDWYLGGQAAFSHTHTAFDTELVPDEIIDQLGLGVSTALDSRNNQLLPSDGKKIAFNTMSYFEELGSTNSYTNINMEYNQYFPIKERDAILARFFAAIATGDVPFSGQNVVGRDDLRGYSNGKYRANQVYAAQSEYRHWFSKKWGYVAFGGIATAVDELDELNINNILPAVGVGVRYLAIPKLNISIGLDVAVGKDDWGLYFRIAEAFTR